MKREATFSFFAIVLSHIFLSIYVRKGSTGNRIRIQDNQKNAEAKDTRCKCKNP